MLVGQGIPGNLQTVQIELKKLVIDSGSSSVNKA